MTSVFAARRAAEEFAGLVDGSRADVADRYADLTDVLTLLREQPPVEARPEFVSSLRESLLAAASTELVPSTPTLRPVPSLVTPITDRRAPGPRQRRFGTAAAAALVVVGGTTGVAAAASGAMPGDGLYTVKRGIESATAALNTSDAGKGAELLRQAGVRLDELETLIGDGADAATIRTTLSDFETSAASGAGLLFSSYETSGRSSDISTVRDYLADHQSALAAIADQAPEASSGDFAGAVAVLESIQDQALQYCSGCGPFSPASLQSDAGTLSRLLAAPARVAPAPQPKQSDLAAAAEDAAASPAPAPTAPTAPSGSSTPLAPVEQVVTGVTGSGTGTLTEQLTGTVKGVTEPVTTAVTGLVDGVGDATGLSPVTDTVTGLLNGLTGN